MAGNDQHGAEPVVIKKYANRRLYNTDKSSYVTLDHLAEMVRDGRDFVVRDAKTGEDITRSVLAQIIFEEEAKGQNLLPANFLRQLIRLYGDTLQGFVPAYLEASMETFSRNQENLREQITQAFGKNPAMAGFEALTRTNMEWFESAMRMFSPFQAPFSTMPARPRDTDAAAQPKPKSVELEDLKSQLEKMQAQLTRLSRES
jgi:polyhydroxyalkanoate synthesis repressor PhaR